MPVTATPHTMKHPLWFILPGASAVLLGLPYLVSLFGPTEAEVRLWGFVSLCAGVVALVVAVTLIDRPSRVAEITLGAVNLLISEIPLDRILIPPEEARTLTEQVRRPR